MLSPVIFLMAGSRRQVLFPLFPNIVYLQASLPATPTAQESLPQPVDVHQHAFVSLFYRDDGMNFQTQQFSDKGFYEHLGSSPFRVLSSEQRIKTDAGVPSKSPQTATSSVQRGSTPVTLFGEEPSGCDA
jgi:hypothetical protein